MRGWVVMDIWQGGGVLFELACSLISRVYTLADMYTLDNLIWDHSRLSPDQFVSVNSPLA